MNDLPVSFAEVDIKMYADETSLLRAFTIKTEFTIMGTAQKFNQLDSEPDVALYKLCISGFEIRRVKVLKYLGLMVDDCLTWEHHIEYITKK